MFLPLLFSGLYEMCFQGRNWTGMKVLIGRCARMMKDWMILQRPEDALILGGWVEQLDAEQARPPALAWEPGATPRDTNLPDEPGRLNVEAGFMGAWAPKF
jgi:hypothetical protein